MNAVWVFQRAGSSDRSRWRSDISCSPNVMLTCSLSFKSVGVCVWKLQRSDSMKSDQWGETRTSLLSVDKSAEPPSCPPPWEIIAMTSWCDVNFAGQNKKGLKRRVRPRISLCLADGSAGQVQGRNAGRAAPSQEVNKPGLSGPAVRVKNLHLSPTLRFHSLTCCSWDNEEQESAPARLKKKKSHFGQQRIKPL